MTKHTPGPWRVEFSGPCSWLIRSDGVHLPGTDENARLIRQAPEMKEEITRLRAIKAGAVALVRAVFENGDSVPLAQDLAGLISEDLAEDLLIDLD